MHSQGYRQGDIYLIPVHSLPARLSADPRTGRLTLNGFFTCRPAAR